MRFLRGLLLGILCFAIMMVSGLIVVGNLTEYEWQYDEEGWPTEYVNVGEISLDRALDIVPEWTIIFLLSILGMFIGPGYYWILEPILQKRREKQAYEADY